MPVRCCQHGHRVVVRLCFTNMDPITSSSCARDERIIPSTANPRSSGPIGEQGLLGKTVRKADWNGLAASHTWFREWVRLGGIETWVRYGSKFYREIRKKRKCYRKGFWTRKTIMQLRRKCEREARKARGLPSGLVWKTAAEEFAKQLRRPR